MAEVNATLVILSYDAAGNGAAAAANITAATGNRAVSVVQLDLSTFGSVRAGAAVVLGKLTRIDVLICDAGIIAPPRGLPPATQDGFDRVVEVNFVGHVLLIDLLLPLLRYTAGRVIHVSSSASFYPCAWGNLPGAWSLECVGLGRLDGDARSTPTGTNQFNVTASNYALTKFMQVFHANELAIREHEYGPPAGHVLAFSLHPGLVATPMIDDVPPAVIAKWCAGTRPCPVTAAEGGATVAYLATAEYGVLADYSGQFFELCAPAHSVRDVKANATGAAATAEYQRLLFDLAQNWTRPR